MQLTIEQIRILLKSYLSSENLDNVIITISPGCNKSDGYVSYIYKITLELDKLIKTYNINKPTVLIIKCAPKNLQYRDLMNVRKLYLSEIFFYESIMPRFIELQHSQKCEIISSIPQFITAVSEVCNEMLVLEDIRTKGYSMLDKRHALDEAHLEFVLKEYGKFHSLSFSLKYHNLEVYKMLVESLKSIHNGRNCNLTESFYNWFNPTLNQTVQLFQQNEKVFKKLKFLQSNLENIFCDIFEYAGKQDVISHMDCWSNNMLFKYDGLQLIAMYLLDFQYVYNTSPVADIAYFFYVSAAKHEYVKLDYYLHVYYNSLRDSCNTMNTPLDYIYPYCEFKRDWQAHAKYGFLRGILGIPLSLRDNEDIIDVKDVVDKGIKSDMAFGVEEWSPQCVEWIKTLTLHMCENNFI